MPSCSGPWNKLAQSKNRLWWEWGGISLPRLGQWECYRVRSKIKSVINQFADLRASRKACPVAHTMFYQRRRVIPHWARTSCHPGVPTHHMHRTLNDFMIYTVDSERSSWFHVRKERDSDYDIRARDSPEQQRQKPFGAREDIKSPTNRLKASVGLLEKQSSTTESSFISIVLYFKCWLSMVLST